MINGLKEYGKVYFRNLLEKQSENIKYGDVLTFGIQFLGGDGKPLTDYTFIKTIHKNEL